MVQRRLSTPRRALGIFLKEPRPSRVKTRLGKVVGMQAAAGLYGAFAADLLEELSRLRQTELWVFFSPAGAADACRSLIAAASAAGADRFRLAAQRRGSLGRRMLGAFEEMAGALAGSPGSGGRAARQARRMLLVGTDLPVLDRRRVRQAFRLLERVDVALGPAVDGGYYLIGLREPRKELFHRVRWSTSGVLEATLRRVRRQGLRAGLLPPMRDVDTWEDLEDLRRQLAALRRQGRAVPRRTDAVCRKIVGARRGGGPFR